MSDPTSVALYGHRFGVYARNVSSGSEIWVDRVQRFDPSQTIRTAPYYELGRVGKIGVTQDPAEYRVVLEKNMSNLELDFLLSGKVPRIDNAVAQQYDLGDLLGQNISMYLQGRNNSDVVDKEIEVLGCRIAEIQFRFTIREAIMETWSFDGTSSKWYTSGFPHGSAWGTGETTSPGGIHGKEARIWFTSGSASTTREFRLQQFNVRVSFPTDQVKELGNRSIVGTLSDSPDITCDFDVLVTDDQPLDKLYTSSGSGWDLNQPSALFNSFIRVFDPDSAEGANVIKMFKLENCRITGGTPTRAQVRGLATSRFTMTVAKETTVDSGGLTVSNRNDLS